MEDEREDVYSKVVRAGKRTYFFDVRSTRGNDLFLTITESKKRTHENGQVSYEKHKIFIYKEDFEKFVEGMHDALDELERIRTTGEISPKEITGEQKSGDSPDGDEPPSGFSDFSFEDLGKP